MNLDDDICKIAELIKNEVDSIEEKLLTINELIRQLTIFIRNLSDYEDLNL